MFKWILPAVLALAYKVPFLGDTEVKLRQRLSQSCPLVADANKVFFDLLDTVES